jgi:apolipoprotein N-acyltransferase
MEPGRKPRWTKDTRLAAKMGAFFVGSGIVWGGALSGEGVVTGVLAGAALWGLIALVVLAYMKLAALRR